MNDGVFKLQYIFCDIFYKMFIKIQVNYENKIKFVYKEERCDTAT